MQICGDSPNSPPPLSLPVLSTWTNTSALRWHNLTLPPSARTSAHPLRFDADTMKRRRSARGAEELVRNLGGPNTQEGSRWESDSRQSFDSPARKSAFCAYGKLLHNACIKRSLRFSRSISMKIKKSKVHRGRWNKRVNGLENIILPSKFTCV